MKKLTYLVSAVLAGLGLSTSANADVSVSGGAFVAYHSAGGVTELYNGGSVGFGLSTTTSSGMTISAAGGISRDVDAATGFTGFDGLTFGTGGATIEVGTDVALSDGVGDVSDVAGDAAGLNVDTVTNTAGVQDDEGGGVSLSTSFGDASVTFAWVADASVDGDPNSRTDNAATTGGSVKISTSMGSVGVTAAYVTVSGATDDTESAVAVSYASDMGTLSAGYGASTGTNDGNVASGAYTMNLDADTSVSIGYARHDVDSTTGSVTEVSLSRSLGGGASLFVEAVSVSGTTTASTNVDGGTSGFAIGTSVSF